MAGDVSAWNGAALRELREALGLTQTQLAERVGVKRDAIARWEAMGRKSSRVPRRSHVLALAAALEVPGDVLAPG